jgi:hypothetical protein
MSAFDLKRTCSWVEGTDHPARYRRRSDRVRRFNVWLSLYTAQPEPPQAVGRLAKS